MSVGAGAGFDGYVAGAEYAAVFGAFGDGYAELAVADGRSEGEGELVEEGGGEVAVWGCSGRYGA